MKVKYQLLIFLSIVVVSCKRLSIQEKVHMMEASPINLLTDSLTFIDDSLCAVSHKQIIDAEYKYVVYFDSTYCKPCQISKLHLWQKYLSNYSPSRLSCLFIFSSNLNDRQSYADALYNSELKYPIFLDTRNVFLKHNPHIPEELMFHTFLLDGNNNVILVGNPLYNEDIKKLFLDIINKKQ